MKIECFSCGSSFIENKNIGKLSCTFHPFKYNSLYNGKRFPIYHYDCCGRSRGYKDEKHFELQEEGCCKIDHASSFSEYEEIKKKPFAILFIEDLNSMGLFQESVIAKISKIEELDGIIRLKTVLDEDPIQIDLKKEYRETLKERGFIKEYQQDYHLTSTDQTDICPSKLYYVYQQELLPITKADTKFRPFIVVRRIGEEIMRDRIKNEKCDYC